MYGPEDSHELQLTYLHHICLTEAIPCWEVPLSTLWYVNEMTVIL